MIVVDESHRSIYNTYLEILDYFKTITIGLTATPTDVIDHNTFRLFDCPDGVLTFAYPYEEAVNHAPPYLCNFQVMKIQTKFQMEGISKRTISLEDQKKLILEGKDIEEINFEGTQLEKQVINEGTNALIVREFMEECIKDPNGVLPVKPYFSVPPWPTLGEWKICLMRCTHSTTASLPRLWFQTIPAYMAKMVCFTNSSIMICPESPLAWICWIPA